MTTTSFTCTCGHEQTIRFESDGYRVLEVWTEDGDLNCSVCGEALDRDAVYAAVSEDHASDSADAADNYEPADR